MLLRKETLINQRFLNTKLPLNFNSKATNIVDAERFSFVAFLSIDYIS